MHDNPTPPFIPGLRLAELFYQEAVAPILDRHFPGLVYAAGLLGAGSDVLGFDTERSTDHGWGPRLLLFLPESPHVDNTCGHIVDLLGHDLPRTFHGYSTNFSIPTAGDSPVLQPAASGPINHGVQVTTVARFVTDRTTIDTYPDVGVVDWLVAGDQSLLELTAGAVFHDGSGELKTMRRIFRFYPHDLWLYRLAAGWMRIGQMEPFVGRTGEVGDGGGSVLIAAGIVRDIMRLAFIMERRYAPYPKWFGTAFARLACAPLLMPHLERALGARTWPEREDALVSALGRLARLQNALSVAPPVAAEVRRFHDRPFRVIGAEEIAQTLAGSIQDERVRHLPPFLGSVDQFTDSTDILCYSEPRRRLRALYA